MATVANTNVITPEGILRDLNQWWKDLAQSEAEANPTPTDDPHPKTGGLLKACAMTFVVAAQSEVDARAAHETVGLLMHDHPSRAILLHPTQDPDLKATIFSECWQPFGKRQQICADGIEIAAGAKGFEEVSRFIVPLRVPDLPVVLWCRGSAPPETNAFHDLFGLADKIIFDSATTTDADEALRGLRRLHAYGYRVADLHWTRLTGWREAVAHVFDDGLKAADIRSARVTYGGDQMTTCARYFEAWVRTSLPTARVAIEPEIADHPGLYSLTLGTRSGDIVISLCKDNMLEITGEIGGVNRQYRTALPANAEDAMMREELGILGADPIYERVLNA
ncbi:MAG: glucose-6-phosphate dehydrogenase assembly protein OpcA [Acidobacteriota bacterium]